MVKAHYLILFILAFPDFPVRHVGHQSHSIYVGPPLVVYIGHPIHHTGCSSIHIYLEAMPVVHFVVGVVDNRFALAYVENSIAHLILQHLTLAKAVVWNIGVNLVLTLGESSKDNQQ